MSVEPSRDRVEVYEAALGRHVRGGSGVWACETHNLGASHGCPVAVAAARVEAERVGLLEFQVNELRDLAKFLGDEASALRAVVEQVRGACDAKSFEAHTLALDHPRAVLVSDVLAILPDAS